MEGISLMFHGTWLSSCLMELRELKQKEKSKVLIL